MSEQGSDPAVNKMLAAEAGSETGQEVDEFAAARQRVDDEENSWLEKNLDDPDFEDGEGLVETFLPPPREEKPQDEDEPAPQPEKAAEETPAPEDQELRLATASLRRDGWTLEDLKALPRDRVVSMAERRMKNQQDTDDAYAELVELRRKGTAPKNDRGSENEAEAAQANDTTTPDQSLRDLAEALSLDDDGAKVLAEAMRRQVEPLRQKLAESNPEVQAAVEKAARVEAELARRDLAERFPQFLATGSPEFKRVTDRMNALQRGAQLGDFKDAADLMETALHVEFRDDIKAGVADRKTAIREARANGQPVTTKTDKQLAAANAKASKKMSYEEMDDAVLNLLEDDTMTEQERMLAARNLTGR